MNDQNTERRVSDEEIVALEGMVRGIALRIRGQLRLRVEADDLIQLGMVGLLEAARRYDPDSGVALGTYAFTRIRGSILDGVGRLTGVSRSLVRRTRRLQEMNEFIESHDMANTDAAPENYVRDAIQGVVFVGAMSELAEDRAAAEEDGATPMNASPEKFVARKELRRLIVAVVAELPAAESELLRAYYIEGRPLAAIGEERGYSRSWMSRLHTRALKNAQEILRTQHGVELADILDVPRSSPR